MGIIGTCNPTEAADYHHLATIVKQTATTKQPVLIILNAGDLSGKEGIPTVEAALKKEFGANLEGRKFQVTSSEVMNMEGALQWMSTGNTTISLDPVKA